MNNNTWTIVLACCGLAHAFIALALVDASVLIAGIFGIAAMACLAGAFVSAVLSLAQEIEW